MGGGLCASYLSAPLIPPGIYPKAEGSSQKAEQGSAAPAPNPTTSSPKRQVLTNRGAGEGRRKGWRQEVRAARTLQPVQGRTQNQHEPRGRETDSPAPQGREGLSGTAPTLTS